MKNRIVIVALLVLAALPGAAGAQPTPEQRIAEAKRRAESTGIPVQLLETKVDEGRAKGVPMDRIAAAVERRLASLAHARAAMTRGGRTVSAADLSAGADAVDAGVSDAALATLTAEAAPAQRAVALAKLAELVRGGEASEQALERVKAAMARGPEALRSLPGQASPQAQERGPPSERGRGQGNGNARGRGRGQGAGGPPASVPGPGKKPDRGNGNGNNGNGNGNGKKP